MASERELDDLLRKKLGGVMPPAPPAMDWSRMAHAAKTGSPSVAPTRSASPIWRVVIGAAVVSGLLWYGYSALPTDAAASIAATEVAQVSGPSSATMPAEPIKQSAVLFPAEGSSATTTSSRETLLGPDTRTGATTGSSVVPRKAPVGGATSAAIGIHDVPAQDIGSDGKSHAPVQPVSVTDPPYSPITVHYDERTPLVEGNVAVGRMDPDVRLEHTTPDGAFRMEGLFPQAAPLLMSPAAAVLDPPSTPAAPRFALSPWVSVAHAIHSPAPTLVADQVDGLGGLNEWLGTAGIRIEYNVTPRVALIGGLQYANKGRLQGTISTSRDVSTDYAISGAYLEVPLAVRYDLPHEGKTFYIRSGVLLQFNARAGSDKVVMNDRVLKEMSTLALSSSSMGAALDIGAGIRFRLGRGIGLFIEPSYQYALSPVVKNNAFDRLPYNPRIHSLGLGTGLTFQLGSR